MVRDGDAALRDTDFRHGLKHPNAGNVPQDFDNEEFDSADDVLPCYSYQPNGIADMNLNPLLVQNIRTHDYFKGLAEIKNFAAVIDEIYTRCSSLNFWMGGSRRSVSQGMQDRGVSGAGVPATPVVLLYKLHTLRLTRRQIKEMLNHTDSPYIRALGVLYLRHVCDPKELWGWLQPYVTDEEELSEFGDGTMTTLGKFVCRTLLETEHLERDVRLPRIPVPILRDITAKLVERGLVKAPEGAQSDRRGESSSSASNSHYRRDGGQRDDASKRRAVDGGSAPKPEKRKCDYCKRFSCIC